MIHTLVNITIIPEPHQTFLTEEPKSKNNSLREPENNFI